MAKILVVDDDEGVQHLLRSFLQKHGHEAICAGTGEEALEEIDARPALVLLDIMLPDMFGIRVLEEMKKKDLSVAVIVVTGVAEQELGIESLEKGALDFVTKPIDLEHLGFLIDFHLLRTANGSAP